MIVPLLISKTDSLISLSDNEANYSLGLGMYIVYTSLKAKIDTYKSY